MKVFFSISLRVHTVNGLHMPILLHGQLVQHEVAAISTIAATASIAGVTNQPVIRNMIAQTAPTVHAYGIWVSKWSIWSQAAPMDARMVVSEIGEQWSP